MCFCYLALINKNNDFQLQTQNHVTFSFKALVSIFFFCRIFEAFDFWNISYEDINYWIPDRLENMF